MGDYKVALRRPEMYATYTKNCKQAGVAVVDQMCFGLLVRTVFPQCGCVTGSSLGRTVYYTGLTSKSRAVVCREWEI